MGRANKEDAMKGIWLAVVAVLALTGSAYALEPEIEAGLKWANPDNRLIEAGGGVQVGVYLPVEQVEGVSVGADIGHTGHDVLGFLRLTEVGDLSQTSFDLAARYSKLTNVGNVEVYGKAALGWSINDLDGPGLEADNSLRIPISLGLRRQIRDGEKLDSYV
jgi:hypothetical protein